MRDTYYLEWSDRNGYWSPNEFYEAVLNCSLDHSYDRTGNGVPYGIPENFEKVFAPIVEQHLSIIEPNWHKKSAYPTNEQRAAFEKELKEANEKLMFSPII